MIDSEVGVGEKSATVVLAFVELACYEQFVRFKEHPVEDSTARAYGRGRHN